MVDADPTVLAPFRQALGDGGRVSRDWDAHQAHHAETTTAAAGFAVDCVSGTQNALTSVAAARGADRPFAVAFVDAQGPSATDAVQAAAQLCRTDPDLQVVLCAAQWEASWDQALDAVGEDRWLLLRKPFDAIEARQAARALARKWRLRGAGGGWPADGSPPPSAARGGNGRGNGSHPKNERAEAGGGSARRSHAGKLETIGQLAAGVAHEIQAPIQSLGDNLRFIEENFQDLIAILDRYVEMLDPMQPPPNWSERAARIAAAARELDINYLRAEIPQAIVQSLEGADRVVELVKSMEEFSHTDGDGVQPVDLNRALQTTITLTRSEWKHAAEMVVRFDPALPRVPCRAGDINQVFLHVIVSAARAVARKVEGTDARGAITVETRTDGESVEVCIHDTGTAAAAGGPSRISDPFQRAGDDGEAASARPTVAADVIIREHHGQLEVESTQEAGTTVTIRLPLAR